MYTRCPQCHTTFRIQAEHIKAAQGMVRCGHCQAIFQSMDHLFDRVDSSGGLSVFPPTVSDLAPGPDLPETPPPATAGYSFEPPESVDEQPLQEPPLAPAGEFLPEQLASLEALFADKEHKHIETEQVRPEMFPSEPDHQPPASEPRGFHFEPPEPEFEHEHTETITPSDDKVLLSHADSAHSPARQENPVAAFAAALSETKAPFPTESIPTRDATRDATQTLRPWLDNLITLTWSVGSLALISLIILQFGYFERNKLARDPTLRPALEAMCVQFGCTLPLREDMSKLEIRDRDVRTHPSVPNALMISALIVNNADFVQPYPELEITFSSMSDKIVGTRRFHTSEFLKGVNLRQGFAPKQKVTAVLEILDPGPNAVNYNFELKAGENLVVKK